MAVLVTGAGGYLGRGVVRALLDEGYDVVAATHSVKEIDPRAIQVVEDIFSVQDIRSTYGEVECVVHLAWKDGFVHDSPEHINNLADHCSFIDRCLMQEVEKIIILGTMHEVGRHEGPVNSSTPCFPTTNYGISKNALREYSLKSANSRTAVQWLRAFYIVSDDEKGESIFSKIVQAEHRGEKLFPFTTGKTLYDFIDYEDFSKQLVEFVKSHNESGTYNIGSGKPVSLASRVEQFIEDNGFCIRLDYGKYPDRPYDSKGIWADMSETTFLLKGEDNEES